MRNMRDMRREREPGPRHMLKQADVQSRPMPRFFRILAVALVAAAVPLQSMASVMAGQCMAFGHHQGGSLTHDLAQHAHDGAGGHDHAAYSHPEPAQDDQGAKKSHCGPCAACCASASIAAPVAPPIPASLSEAKHVFSQFPPVGIAQHGLYRPPLSL